MFSHGIPPLVYGGSVQRAFFALVVVVAFIVVNANRSPEGGKAGVMGADGIAGRHAKASAWRADSFGDGIKGEVFDKVASDGLTFEFFGLVHSVMVVGVSGCVLALHAAPSHEGAGGKHVSNSTLDVTNHACGAKP